MHIPFKSIGILLCFSGTRLKDSIIALSYSGGQDTAGMATYIQPPPQPNSKNIVFKNMI